MRQKTGVNKIAINNLIADDVKEYGPDVDGYGRIVKENGRDVNEYGLAVREYGLAVDDYEAGDNDNITETALVLHRHKRWIGSAARFAVTAKTLWAGTKVAIRIAGAGGLMDV